MTGLSSTALRLVEQFEDHVVRKPDKSPLYFDVSPVFSRPGLPCDPDMEMLSVVAVHEGCSLPVDCIPLRELKERDAGRAGNQIRAAFTKAHSELRVSRVKPTRDQMAGWEITVDGVDAEGKEEIFRLEFVLKHHGRDRVNQLVRNRTRERAHELLGLSLGPSHYSFLIQHMRPF